MSIEKKILRSSFFINNSKDLVVKYNDDAYVSLCYKDHSDREISDQDISSIARNLSEEKFCLDGSDGYIRGSFVTTCNSKLIVLVLHHIVFDAHTVKMLIDGIGEYCTTKAIKELNDENYYVLNRVQASDVDVCHEVRSNLKNSEPYKPIKYLPYSVASRCKNDFVGAHEYLVIDGSMYKSINDLSRSLNSSPFHTLVACISILLYKYGNNEFDIATTTSTQGRLNHPSVWGPMFDTLLFSIKADEDSIFSDFVRSIRDNVWAASNLERFYDDSLVFDNNQKRSPGLPKLYINWEGEQILDTIAHNGIYKKQRTIDAGRSKNDLAVYIGKGKESFHMTFEYSKNMFTGEYMKSFIYHLQIILDYVLANPKTKLSFVPIYDKSTLDKLVYNMTGDRNTSHATNSVIEKILANANSNPDKIALEDSRNNLTYRDLSLYVIAIEKRLYELGIKKGDVVVTLMKKSIKQVSVSIAIMRYGAVYLPIDYYLPKHRITYILDDSNAVLCVVDNDDNDNGYEPPRRTTLNIAAIKEGKCMPDKVYNKKHHDDLAYIIYTSGSSGLPKGVQIKHSSLNNSIIGLSYEIGINNSVRFLNIVNNGFDISLLDVISGLSSAGYIYVVSDKDKYDTNIIKSIISSRNKSHVHCTPSMWRILLANEVSYLDGVVALSGGEKIEIDIINKLRGCASVIWDLYGPTEATIYTSAYRVECGDHRTAIGRPIANVRYDIDEICIDTIPIGYIGQLSIYGMNTSIGYVNDNILTSRYFVNERDLYYSGDYVQLNPLLKLEYQERIDNQVKINGNRVNISEVRHVLQTYMGLDDVEVICIKYGSQKQLVAFYSDQSKSSIDDIDNISLSNYLPGYMMPRDIIKIERMPLNSNGKVDLLSLKKKYGSILEEININNEYDNMDDAILNMKRAWSQALQLEMSDLSLDDNFFEIGGDSFKATLMVSYLEKHTPLLSINIIDIFTYPTISQLVKHLESSKSINDDSKQKRMIDNVSKIAIIGYSFKCVGVEAENDLWSGLISKKSMLKVLDDDDLIKWGVPQFISESENYVPCRNIINDLNEFSYDRYNMSYMHAYELDVQQRHMLMLTDIALKQTSVSDSNDHTVGTYIGVVDNGFSMINSDKNDFYDLARFVKKGIYADTSYVASRVSHTFNFTGPALSINTACSSGLSAIISACDSIKQGHCSVAVTGAVNLQVPPRVGYSYEPGFIFSKSGRCSPFSTDADGTVPSSVAGVFILKSLDNAINDDDYIHAVISGYATNNDGSDKATFTSPSKKSQVKCAKTALASSCVDPSRVQYIEMHGTGTKIGDAIETASMSEVYGSSVTHKQICIGSIKANIGHGGNAASVASMVKAILMIKHRIFTPQANLDKVSEAIKLNKSPNLIINEEQIECDDSPICIAINSTGIGGTNCHMVLEEYVNTKKYEPYDHTSYSLNNLKTVTFPIPNKIIDYEKTEKYNPQTLDTLTRTILNTIEYDNIPKDGRLLDLAIDSLAQIMICDKLSELYGFKISPEVFVGARTVEEVFYNINDLNDESIVINKNTKLVPLSQTDQPGCNLVFVHPGHGYINCYNKLSQELSSTLQSNIYAIARPLQEDENTGLAQIATEYVDMINQKLTGTTILLGWSLGGIIAREVNVRLQEDSRIPSFIFDGWAKLGTTMFNRDIFQKKYSKSFKRIPKQMDILWKRIQIMNNMKLTESDDKIVLFKANDLAEEYQDCDDMYNHWKEYTDYVSMYKIQGSHDTMIDIDQVGCMSKIISETIKKILT